ncbi:hypothetical protein [Curtobacterium sp. MCBD17_032]|uniref:hypothetical protein n=1 Tax=Curtobacterium sp. MCBD17_032 TaxID=2175659 RepID=UPI000DA942DE|nr:hypothetical protein [Curtobacterium sp. MCBD17_032]PZE83266.1 hypothetical protein DEI91_10125 [Curtobacterium sp. MCBD17_032]
MGALHALAFWCAAASFAIRAPSIGRNPHGRASWAATGVGALGLLTLGAVVPQRDLDALLGGTNLLNLVQNLCATTAFWLLFRGSVRSVDRRPALSHPFALVVMLASFTVPFLFIRDRGDTVFTFIVDEIDQTATWLYACVYMACVAVITATTLARGVLGSRGALVVFRVGLSLVTIASAEEIVSLTADHFVLGSVLLRDVLRTAFDPPFYLGIVLMVAAMASMTVRRWAREARLRGHRVRLARIARRLDLRARRRRGGLQVRTYDLLIAIRDAEVQGRELTPAETASVRSAELMLAKDLAG